MATNLTGTTIASTYEKLIKRADTYVAAGVNIEVQNDSAVAAASSLYLDITNGNVGIGDTLPAEAKLSITGVAAGDIGLKVEQDQSEIGIFIDQDGNGGALYIDTEATTGVAIEIPSPANQAGNIIEITGADALTTGAAMKIDCGSTSLATTVTGGLVEILHDADSDTNVNHLLHVVNDHADSTGTIGIYVQQDSTGPAISATGGIVEQGGTLKENLLTNSGFDVWSNSTMENVGSDLVTGGAFTGGASGWTLETGWSASSNHLVSTSGGFNNAAYRSITTVAGKLYRVSITCDGYTDGSVAAWTNAQSLIGNVLTGTGTSTVIFEATGTSHSVGAIIKTAGSDFTADDFTCFEVTPACIASNNLAMDGWFKGSSTDIYRQHNDGGTLTKDGSFYGLYMDWAAAGDYVQWPGVNLRSKAEHYQRFAGRTVTFGCWMKTSKASHGKLTIEDNSGTVATSGLHTGGGGWEWLEITHTMGGSITLFSVLITGAQAVDGTDTDIYASQPMLVFGSSIGEGNYTSPQGEIIYLTHKSGGEHSFANFSGTEDYSSAQAVNTEAESSGMIPKGVKAVLVRLQAQSSTVPTLVELTQASGLNTHYTMLTQVSNQASSLTGWMTCDDSGDFDIAFQNATDNVLIAVQGVHLH